jgi:hypothetical protein
MSREILPIYSTSTNTTVGVKTDNTKWTIVVLITVIKVVLFYLMGHFVVCFANTLEDSHLPEIDESALQIQSFTFNQVSGKSIFHANFDVWQNGTYVFGNTLFGVSNFTVKYQFSFDSLTQVFVHWILIIQDPQQPADQRYFVTKVETSLGEIIKDIPFEMAHSMTLNVNQYRNSKGDMVSLPLAQLEIRALQRDSGSVLLRRGLVTTVEKNQLKLSAVLMGFSFITTFLFLLCLVLYLIYRDVKLKNKIV